MVLYLDAIFLVSLFVDSKSNPTATNVCNHITAGLIGFDIIEKDGKTYKLNK